MTDLSVNDTMDLIFRKLDPSGRLFDKLMRSIAEVSPEDWGTSPTMMVDLRVPHHFRRFLDGLELPDGMTRGQLESTLFTFFVVHGITSVLSDAYHDHSPQRLGGTSIRAIPIDKDSPLGGLIQSLLRRQDDDDDGEET